nr:MAG TPA: tail collar fiber protein [Caudoviricetes sp.]
MSAFKGMKITNEGKQLLTETLVGKEIEFTSIKLGDGEYTGNIEELNNLVSLKKEMPIYNLRVIDSNKMIVGSVLIGSEITTGFFWKEIGVFARNKTDNLQPILFAYDNAVSNATYIPNGGSVIEQVINVEMIVSNTQNVTAKINDSLVYLLKNNPEFIGSLLTAGKEIIKVDTRLNIGNSELETNIISKNRIMSKIDGKDYQVMTSQDIVISNTQPEAIPGKTIIWLDSSEV